MYTYEIMKNLLLKHNLYLYLIVFIFIGLLAGWRVHEKSSSDKRMFCQEATPLFDKFQIDFNDAAARSYDSRIRLVEHWRDSVHDLRNKYPNAANSKAALLLTGYEPAVGLESAGSKNSAEIKDALRECAF